MLRHIRKFAWLTGAVAVVLSLTLGAILAHEGRPVGDYRFIVGWLEEPAYEGFQNGVSVRINKIVEGEAMPEGEGEKHEAMPTGEAKEDDHGLPAITARSRNPRQLRLTRNGSRRRARTTTVRRTKNGSRRRARTTTVQKTGIQTLRIAIRTAKETRTARPAWATAQEGITPPPSRP